jgi:hypothetical protein
VSKAHDNNNVYVVLVGDEHRIVNVEDIHVLGDEMQDEDQLIEKDSKALFVGIEAEDNEEEKKRQEEGLDEKDIKSGSIVLLEDVAEDGNCYLAKAICDGGQDVVVEYHILNRITEKDRFYPVWLKTNKAGKVVKYFRTQAGPRDEPMLISCGKDWRVLKKDIALKSGRMSEEDKVALGDTYLRIPMGRNQ